MSITDVINPHNEKLVSDNSMKTIVKTITPNELINYLKIRCSIWIFDLRNTEKYWKSHIINSKHANCTTNIMTKMSINRLKKEFSLVDKLPEKIILYNQNNRFYNSCLLQFINKIFLNNARLLEGGFEIFSKVASNEFIEIPNKILRSPTNTDLISEDIMQTKMTEIEPNLFLGNADDSGNLELLLENGITHILSVASTVKNSFENNFQYKRIEANDNQNQNLLQYFEESFQFIENVKLSNGKVLVHCLAGVSRSVTIVAAYLIKKYGLNTLQALDKVRDKRAIASPNLSFLGQLDRYYQALNPNFKN